MEIYGQIKVDIGKILRQLCQQKGIEIIEAELCKDHIHMLVSIPPKYSVSQIMGYLKGKSSLGYFYFVNKNRLNLNINPTDIQKSIQMDFTRVVRFVLNQEK